jgi:tetratricopeptide (TPR) repeat protein
MSVFAGRTTQLARLDAVLTGSTAGPTQAEAVSPGPAPVVVIAGGGGVGKTALAVHWSHLNSDRFPDGQLYANLRGFDPNGHAATPDDVVRGFLSALNLPAAGVPTDAEARFSLFRSLLADKRMLVVLDNARDADQVRPLLPGAPGCLTVVTSREQLPSLVATAGAAPVVLGLLSPGEARDLLSRRVGAARVEAEPEAVSEIAELCARLPLALAIVAARAATHVSFSLASLTDELREARGDLDVFDMGDSTTSVRAVFSWSYLALSERAAELFRSLGLHPGPHVTPAAAASMLGVPVRQARTLLAELARAHLIIESSHGHFGCHDLLRAYATEFTHDEHTRHTVVRRMLDHYLHSAAEAVRPLRPQQAVPMTLDPARDGVTVAEIRTELEAAAWFGAEYAVLHALIELAARDGFDSYAYRLTDTLTTTLWYGGARWLGETGTYRTALAAARRAGDPLAQALAHRAFAVLHLTHDRFDDAEEELFAALGFAEEVADVGLLADVHQGLAKVSEGMGRHTDQREHTEQALDLFRAAGNDVGVANSYNNLAWCLTELGDYERAVTLCKQALEMFVDLPDRKGEANTWDTLGYASLHLGHHDEAISCYRRAVELHRAIRSRGQEANAHRKIGDIHHDRGAVEDARTEWRQAVDIFEELGLRGRADALRTRLATVPMIRSASSAKLDG